MDPMPAEFTEEVKPEPSEAAASETPAAVADSEPAEKNEEKVEREETPPGDDTQPETPAQKKESKVQKRIDELTRKNYEKDAQIEYYKGLAEGRQPTQPEQQLVTENIPGLRPKPTLEQFDFDTEAHAEAVADWVIDKRELKAQQSKSIEQHQKVIQAHTKRVETAATIYPDFSEVMDAANAVPITAEMEAAIVHSELGGDLMYYLAKHPEETANITKLPPARQLVELGKIEARFEKKETPPKRVTQAPEPIKPVGGPHVELETVVDDNEWHRREQARLRKLGRLY